MNDYGTATRSRPLKPKNDFQSELQAKLHQRKSLGLTAEVTDSEDDTMDFMKKGGTRPSAAKRRQDNSPDLSRGLGTTTMSSRNLSSLMGRDVSDDEDSEIMAANLGRGSPGGSYKPGSMKTPSPTSKLDSLYGGRKTPTSYSPKESGSKLDNLFGRKTPTKESQSPKGLSKEDIIFGRKTPTDGRKTPNDGRKTPGDGKKSPLDGRQFPGVDDKTWQPPNFRSASPGGSDGGSRGSRGVTPVDGSLGTISESVTPRMPRGQKSDVSPRQFSMDERPKPQARSRGQDQKTSPLGDPRRGSPTSQKAGGEGGTRRASPSIDLFGGKSRAAASQDVDKYMDKDRDEKRGGYRLGGRSPSPDSRRQAAGSPSRQAGRFTKDGRQTPTDRKTPIGDRKTPTGNRKTPTSFDRKTPTGFDRRKQEDKKGAKAEEEEEEEMLKKKQQAMKGQSLLDFLTEDASASKPEPKTRARERGNKDDDDIDDIFNSNKKIMNKSKSSEGPRSPRAIRRKSTDKPHSAENLGETPLGPPRPKDLPADSSSICEEIPLDPNRRINAAGKTDGKQRTDRAQADSAIDTIAEAQTMQFIEPAKKIRPVTASAKVQCRPKPRYGNLPGEGKTLEERQFNSTGDIRDAIYEEWYRERIRTAKLKKKEDEKNQKEKEEKEIKEKKEKRLENDTTYRVWMEKKKEVLGEKEHKKRKEERLKQKKVEDDEKEKKIESVKCFEHWKEKKDGRTKRELTRKKEEEQQKKENEQYEKRMKDKDRTSAFDGWQKRKEKEWKNESKQRKTEKKSKKQLEEEEKEKLQHKEEEAMDRYYEWMEDKEKQARQEKKLAKQRRMMGEDDYKPAWSPASRTIPFGS